MIIKEKKIKEYEKREREAKKSRRQMKTLLILNLFYKKQKRNEGGDEKHKIKFLLKERTISKQNN